MKFKFRLEAVLKLRRRLEDEAQRAFTESRAVFDEANAVLKRMYESIDRGREKIAQTQRDGKAGAIATIGEIESFIVGQGLRIKKQREVLRSAQQDLEEKQEALILALRERKSLEKLKERKKKEHDMDVARREALALDEIATIRAGGRR